MHLSFKKITIWLSLLVISSLLLISCGAEVTPTETEPPVTDIPTRAPTKTPKPTRTPKPTPTEPPPPQTFTVCLGQEPESLYPFGPLSTAARSVLSMVYAGPVDQILYDPYSEFLTRIPSFEDGSARIEPVQVSIGYEIVDADGNPVTLDQGVRVRPSGCTSDDCVVAFDGGTVMMDQLVVSFELRNNVLWSDGTPLKATDSAYGYFLDSSAKTPGTQYLLQRTQYYGATGEYTAEWRGKPGFLDESYYANFWMPAPEHIWGGLSTLELPNTDVAFRTPLGWGPYVISGWTLGESIQLAKNPNFGEELAFDLITFKFAATPDNAISLLLNGTCDMIDPSVPLDGQLGLLREMQQSGQLKLYTANQPIIEKVEFGIQSADPNRINLLGDARTRQALVLCMDRRKAVDTVLFGLPLIPDTYLSPEDPTYNASVDQYPFDVEAGSTLLNEVGWRDFDSNPETPRVAQGVPNVPDGTPLKLEYVTTSALQRRQVSEILAASLAQCGVKVDLVYLTPEELYASGPDGILFGRKFDLAQFSMGALGSVPSCTWYESTSIPARENDWVGTNLAGYRSSNYDAACQAATLSLPGQGNYLEKRYATQTLFAQDLPFVPLYTRLRIAASRPDLCYFELDAMAPATFWNIKTLTIADDCSLP